MNVISNGPWPALPKSLAPLYARFGGRLPGVAAAVLTLLIAGMLAQVVWALLPTPAAGAWAPMPVAAAPDDPANRIDLGRIASAKLFGQMQAAPGPTAAAANAPETQLNLKLLGILSSRGNNRFSRALIGDGTNEQPYAVGDQVTRGVILKEIYADRVILSRNGRLETLRLTKDQSSAPETTTAQAGEDNPDVDPNAATLVKIRDQIVADPSKAEDFLRIEPARVPGGNGQIGYRVTPGKDRRLFTSSGLQPGDVVTAVNGVQLSDPAKSLQLLGDLTDADQLSLVVQRGGSSQTINVNLTP
jgi:general secretion pathway protein C